MVKYSITRLLQSAVTVLIVATIVFLLMRALPTDYFFTEEEVMKLTEQQKQDRLEAAGLNDPVAQQLLRFYNELLHGDLGKSRRIRVDKPVIEIIQERFPVSMKLGLISLGISLVLGIALGILQVLNKEGPLDHLGMIYTIFVNAVPPLVTYSLVLMFGAKVLDLPSMFSKRNELQSSIMPVVCLSLSSIAHYAMWTRRYMVDELNKDYLRLCRVKGMPTKDIMIKHVLKNAFVPLIAYIPASILFTIGGSLLVERFFGIPGMGPLLVDSIGRYDTPLVQGLVVLYASMSVIGVFLGDVMMTVMDPRIKLTGKGDTR
ncbi:MAG: ABC transporter permease [Oscillospiraceae bacterium]|jgi:oligopeptide transport system permease protein|nr:ABC transporter permease [Oscillospiraceae bacterium]